jgi:hypothetical protein
MEWTASGCVEFLYMLDFRATRQTESGGYHVMSMFDQMVTSCILIKPQGKAGAFPAAAPI